MILDDVKRANGSGSGAWRRSYGRWVAKVTLGRRDGRQWQRGFCGSTAEEADRKRDAAMRRLVVDAPLRNAADRMDDAFGVTEAK